MVSSKASAGKFQSMTPAKMLDTASKIGSSGSEGGEFQEKTLEKTLKVYPPNLCVWECIMKICATQLYTSRCIRKQFTGSHIHRKHFYW